jgi:hypothetical protein
LALLNATLDSLGLKLIVGTWMYLKHSLKFSRLNKFMTKNPELAEIWNGESKIGQDVADGEIKLWT